MKLYAHQQRLVDLNPEKHLCAWAAGSGKTIAAISLGNNNLLKDETCIVVCPKSLSEQWEEEIGKYATDTKVWEVYTKETFRRDWKIIDKSSVFIFDEADFLGNYKSQLTKSVNAYLRKHNVRCRYLLTATPYRSGIMNLFSLGLILGKDWKWYKWDRLFFNRIKMGNRHIPVQKINVDGIPITKYITKIINELGSSVALEQCWDIPEQIFKTETFQLTKEQRKAMENITDTAPIVRFTRRHQIEQGFIAGDKGYTEHMPIKCEKNDRIKELCDQHDKVAIICRYNFQIELYKRILKDKKIFIINGATKDKHQQTKDIDKIDKCVVLIQSATVAGYELPSINFIIFASYDFSLAAMIQARGRFLRANRLTHNVYVSLVQEKGTVDYDIHDTLINKKLDYHLACYEEKT